MADEKLEIQIPSQGWEQFLTGRKAIKRFVRGDGYFLLKPESTNSEHKPIIVNRDFYVQGVVTKVLKRGSELLRYLEQ